jgi:hypothetical protein
MNTYMNEHIKAGSVICFQTVLGAGVWIWNLNE